MSWIKGFAWILGFFLVASFMGWIWWNYPELITIPFPELAVETLEKRGVFGDMFGSLNAFFSGIALVGVIFAVFMQRNELQLQRIDLQRSIKAQEESSQALSEQLKEMQEQTELQLLPFLVVRSEQIGEELLYYIANVGNSTAVNIGIYNITDDIFVSTMSMSYSALAKSDHVPLSLDYPAEKDLIIIFENINKKSYYIKENINGNRTDIIEFKEGSGLEVVYDIRGERPPRPLVN